MMILAPGAVFLRERWAAQERGRDCRCRRRYGAALWLLLGDVGIRCQFAVRRPINWPAGGRWGSVPFHVADRIYRPSVVRDRVWDICLELPSLPERSDLDLGVWDRTHNTLLELDLRKPVYPPGIVGLFFRVGRDAGDFGARRAPLHATTRPHFSGGRVCSIALLDALARF